VVESQPSKLLVAGSIPVSRSNLRSFREHRLASQDRLSTVARSMTVGWRAIPRTRAGGNSLICQHALTADVAPVDLSAMARLLRRSAEREGGSAKADVAQLAERVLGKDEVTSSILVIGSSLCPQDSERDSAGRATLVAKACPDVRERTRTSWTKERTTQDHSRVERNIHG
jgi:hypothetical protein